MKRKLWFAMLALSAGALTPISAIGQLAKPDAPAQPEKLEPTYRYAVSAGYGYTSLNQINQSRSGLQGVEVSVMRDFSRHFGLMADGAVYQYAIKSGNPGSPSVDMVLFGPMLHADLYGRFGAFVRAFIGGEHTGGDSISPNISVAGGFGLGMDYKLNPRFSLRASGDDILASFAQDPGHLGNSTHRRANGRAALSVVYHF